MPCHLAVERFSAKWAVSDRSTVSIVEGSISDLV